MASRKHNVLVGLMGSGKSVLGKLLASRLSLSLIDLDAYIVQQAGESIPEIFATKGEQYFRQLEGEYLAEVLATDDDVVVATGGGAVLAAENRALMQEKGKVIWLDASPEILAKRIAGDSNRPLLDGVDVLEKMQGLAVKRNPLYAQVADLCVNTETSSDEEAVAKIIKFLSE